MIQWNESAKLNNCCIEELVARFGEFPHSHKKVVAICNSCGKVRQLEFRGYHSLCRKCAVNTPEAIESNRLRAIKQWSDPESCMKMSRIKTKFYKDNPCFVEELSKSHLKEKPPLPDGWESKKLPANKDCESYRGEIAERLLSKVFIDVKVMPYGNHGYDIVCNKDYKIDVKGSYTGYKGDWQFGIRKNEIADYFLLLAFESKKSFAPEHLWLIPGNAINRRNGLHIFKSNIDKWSEYEQPIDNVVSCCNEMKSNGNNKRSE